MLLIEFIVDLDFLEDYSMVRFSSWIYRSPKGGFAEGSVCEGKHGFQPIEGGVCIRHGAMTKH